MDSFLYPISFIVFLAIASASMIAFVVNWPAIFTVKIGENIYYTEYTKQIEDIFETTDEIRLSEGDFVKIDVENINETLYQTIQKSLYNVIFIYM